MLAGINLCFSDWHWQKHAIECIDGTDFDWDVCPVIKTHTLNIYNMYKKFGNDICLSTYYKFVHFVIVNKNSFETYWITFRLIMYKNIFPDFLCFWKAFFNIRNVSIMFGLVYVRVLKTELFSDNDFQKSSPVVYIMY